MIKLLGIVVVVVALAFLLLGINVFLFRRKFPETEIGNNGQMKKLGLACPHGEEKKQAKNYRKPIIIHPKNLRPDWDSMKSK